MRQVDQVQRQVLKVEEQVDERADGGDGLLVPHGGDGHQPPQRLLEGVRRALHHRRLLHHCVGRARRQHQKRIVGNAVVPQNLQIELERLATKRTGSELSSAGVLGSLFVS
eukprot:4781193-Pleurochrysis_carterae.AAC.2